MKFITNAATGAQDHPNADSRGGAGAGVPDPFGRGPALQRLPSGGHCKKKPCLLHPDHHSGRICFTKCLYRNVKPNLNPNFKCLLSLQL